MSRSRQHNSSLNKTNTINGKHTSSCEFLLKPAQLGTLREDPPCRAGRDRIPSDDGLTIAPPPAALKETKQRIEKNEKDGEKEKKRKKNESKKVKKRNNIQDKEI